MAYFYAARKQSLEIRHWAGGGYTDGLTEDEHVVLGGANPVQAAGRVSRGSERELSSRSHVTFCVVAIRFCAAFRV